MLETLVQAATPLLEPLSALRRALLQLSGDSAAAPVATGSEMSWLKDFVARLTPALGEFFVFFATLSFFIAGRMELRRGMIMAWPARDSRLAAIRILNAIDDSLVAYFAVTASVYLGVAAATAAIAGLAGLPNPLLWGIMTFTACFIPYLGAALVTLALAAGGLTAHAHWVWALMPAGAFLLVHLVTENAVIPSLLGRRLELNSFVVFLAIVFWGWMWGPVGTMLATPLLLVAETIFDILNDKHRVLPD